MKKTLLLTAVVCLCLSAALSQDTLSGVYLLNYFSGWTDSGHLDQTTRIINPGTRGTPLQSQAEGAICAAIYVFDARQEMEECCHCRITANGLLELSLRNDLLDNPLTGFPAPANGVIKIVSDDGNNCNEQSPRPVPTLLAWQTHVQEPQEDSYVITEDEFLEAPLTYGSGPKQSELDFLGQACTFVQYLGSGKGLCFCINEPR